MTYRIVQIIPTLDQGGAEKQLALLATRLPRDMFEVHVCTLTRGGPYEQALREREIPIHAINKHWKFDPAAYWRLRAVLRRLRPQLVHTWIFAANSYGRYAAFHAGVPRVVAGERCVDRWKVWHELAIDRHLARHTDRIVANSSGVVDFYVQHGIPKAKFEVIPNAISEQSGVAPIARDEALQRVGVPRDARVIGAVGRLWPQKNYRDLIWAAELLKVIRDDTHLVVIGDGPQRAILERWRRHLEITDRVHFVGHREDVPQLLPHFDCFWLASAYEGQSNALMEAMLAGVPAVVSDIPGNRDLVEHGKTGYLFPVGDRAAIARLTNQLLEDPATARRIAAAAQKRMKTEFTVEKMIDRHVELYKRLLERDRIGP